MKWIKASERLPELKADHYFKFKEHKYTGWLDKYFHSGRIYFKLEHMDLDSNWFDQIEWLDESESPSQSKETPVAGTIEEIEVLLYNDGINVLPIGGLERSGWVQCWNVLKPHLSSLLENHEAAIESLQDSLRLAQEELEKEKKHSDECADKYAEHALKLNSLLEKKDEEIAKLQKGIIDRMMPILKEMFPDRIKFLEAKVKELQSQLAKPSEQSMEITGSVARIR